MSKALFTFTIGPVKSLVENGRKMDDLDAGSKLLSELIKVAIAFLESSDINVIFPSKDMISLPNRLVAKFENYEEYDALKIATSLEEHVRTEFKKIYKQGFSIFKNVATDRLEKGYAQLDHFLEVYWLFEPYASDDEYSEAYQRLFSKMHMIKGVREFSQLNELSGRKCSLHPEYNGVFVRKGNCPTFTATEGKIDVPDNLKDQIKENESLSAVAMLKRLYTNKHSNGMSQRDIVFKSQMKVITKNNQWYVENIKTQEEWTKTQLTNAIYDIWDNLELTHELTKQEYSEKTLDKAKDIVQNLKRRFGYFKIQQYYALLKFDGDSMGDKYKNLSESDHSSLSEKICRFASTARKLIDEVGGHCIYAGGEDILAVVPLEEIWVVLKKLHQAFGIDVSVAGQEMFTFSAGITIAHLMQPLKDVMHQVSEAEKYAKGNVGKNSFAIALMKRGSETRMTRHSFSNEYEEFEAFCGLITQFKAGNNSKSSKTFIYETSELLHKVSSGFAWEMMQALIKQSMDRKKMAFKEEILAKINLLSNENATKDLINTLNIVGFLAKEVHGDDL